MLFVRVVRATVECLSCNDASRHIPSISTFMGVRIVFHDSNSNIHHFVDFPCFLLSLYFFLGNDIFLTRFGHVVLATFQSLGQWLRLVLEYSSRGNH